MSIARWYVVVSPEFLDPYPYGAIWEPPEPSRDVLWVRARNKRRARALAVKRWLKGRVMLGVREGKYIESGENPYTGVEVHLVNQGESPCSAS